ncbi:hypothetical protein ACHAQH_008782 [Verticillium albo-atrum]
MLAWLMELLTKRATILPISRITLSGKDVVANSERDMRKLRSKDISKRWLGSVGEGVFIEPPFTSDCGCNVIIGKNTYVNFGREGLRCLVY